MVLLTMTSTIVEALEKLQINTEEQAEKTSPEISQGAVENEPSLELPSVGNPISHSQVLHLSRTLKSSNCHPYHLDELLRGCKVYIAPPPPKKKPVRHATFIMVTSANRQLLQTPEYKALMARLRREQEAREYERMINPPQPMETFSQRFPASSAAHAFSSTQYMQASEEDDEIVYTDVNRQVTVIFNVLVSIVACAAALWTAARYWSTPARLALSMSGSILVGIAEVVVYSGYIRRLTEAKEKSKKIKEVKEIVNTWVVDGISTDSPISTSDSPVTKMPKPESSSVRKRHARQDSSS
jgi:hypothetical protein